MFHSSSTIVKAVFHGFRRGCRALILQLAWKWSAGPFYKLLILHSVVLTVDDVSLAMYRGMKVNISIRNELKSLGEQYVDAADWRGFNQVHRHTYTTYLPVNVAFCTFHSLHFAFVPMYHSNGCLVKSSLSCTVPHGIGAGLHPQAGGEAEKAELRTERAGGDGQRFGALQDPQLLCWP